jgi:FkbM family methyltransferase
MRCVRRFAKSMLHHPAMKRISQTPVGLFIMRGAGLPRTERAGSVTRIDGVLVCANFDGQLLRFFVRNRRDFIQAYHLRGEFYEAEELQIIRTHFKAGGVFVDIGANVGNHTIFAAKILGAQKVIPFEVNPTAIEVLRANILLNNCTNVDTAFLGFGVARSDEPLFLVPAYRNNLGGTSFARHAGVGIGFPTIKPDVALANADVDFIKIDIEGMELEALESLGQTVERCSPTIFVEIQNENYSAFEVWCRKHRYEVIDRFVRYVVNANYLIVRC